MPACKQRSVENRCSSSWNELDIVVVVLLRVGREEWKGRKGKRERRGECIQVDPLRGP